MRRCWETAGRLIWKCPAIVLTERSASTRRSSIRRRAGWLIAPKTFGSRSAVTAMLPIYVRKHLRVKADAGLVVVDARLAPGPHFSPTGYAANDAFVAELARVPRTGNENADFPKFFLNLQ